MYKKRTLLTALALFLINILYSHTSAASFWDLFCESTKIRAGGKEEKVYACLPPYGRKIAKGGADPRTGCLKKLDFPVDFQFFMFDICMENVMVDDPSERDGNGNQRNAIFSRRYASYSFDPELIIRTQRVSYSVYYWESDYTLKHGECVIIPNPAVGIPTTRVCARKAGPIDSDENGNSRFDHGYTRSVYIDSNGKEMPDPKIPLDEKDQSGKPVEAVVDYMKLCAYDDPGIIQNFEMFLLTGGIGFLLTFDLMDANPFRQPNHKGAEPPGFIMAIFTIATSPAKLVEMLVKAFDNIPLIGDLGIGSFFGKIINGNLAFAKKIIIDLFSSNRIVYTVNGKESYGCINIPIGPYPPKYCAKLTTIPPSPEVHKICTMDQDGVVAKSNYLENIVNGVRYERCVLSNQYDNNFISNTIRVGISKLIPICDSKIKDDCAKLSSGVKTKQALAIHNQGDIINNCSGSVDPNCVTFVGSKAQSLTHNKGTFRPVYATRYEKGNDDILLNQSDFYSELNNSELNNGGDEVVVYAINIGEYKDVNLEFTNSNAQGKYIYNLETIKYKNKTYDLWTQIGTWLNRTQGDDEICSYQRMNYINYQKIGCEKRASTLKPEVSYTKNLVDYTTEEKEQLYSEPKMKITLKVDSKEKNPGGKKKSKYSVDTNVTVPIFKENPTGGNTDDGVSVALAKYSISMIEKDYKSENLSDKSYDNNCKNYPVSKDVRAKSNYCGNYFPKDIDSIDVNGDFVKDNFFIGGFEKIGGKYRRGGGWLCIQDNDNSSEICDSNPKNMSKCVLAKCKNPGCVDTSSKDEKKVKFSNVSTKLEDRILPNIDTNVRDIDKKGFEPSELFAGCKLGSGTEYCSIAPDKDSVQETPILGSYSYSYKDKEGKDKTFTFSYECVGYKNTKDPTKKCYVFNFNNKASFRNKTSDERGLCLKIEEEWTPKCKGGTYPYGGGGTISITKDCELGEMPKDSVSIKCPPPKGDIVELSDGSRVDLAKVQNLDIACAKKELSKPTKLQDKDKVYCALDNQNKPIPKFDEKTLCKITPQQLKSIINLCPKK